MNPAVKKLKTFGLCVSILAAPSMAVAQSSEKISQTRTGETREHGDVLMYALPLSAYLATWLHGDKEGAIQYSKAALTTALTTEGVKLGAEKVRPDGGSRNSYPSGHTAAAFSGAAFLYTRYGPTWGLPAYGFAGYTAYSRVWANAHFIDDVMAGGNVAFFSNAFFATPFDSGAQLSLNNIDGANVLTVTKALTPTYEKTKRPDYEPTDFTYWFTFGPADVNKHQSSFRPGSGRLDFNDLDNVNNPLTKSRMRMIYEGVDRWAFLADFEPFDVRDIGTVKSPMSAGNVVINTGDKIKHRYLNYKAQMAAYYQVANGDWGELYAGLALNYFYNRVEIENTNIARAGQFNVTEKTLAVPFYLAWHYQIDPRWDFIVAGSHDEVTSEVLVDWEAKTQYRFSEKISGSIGYRRYKHEFSRQGYTDFMEFDAVEMGLGYHF